VLKHFQRSRRRATRQCSHARVVDLLHLLQKDFELCEQLSAALAALPKTHDEAERPKEPPPQQQQQQKQGQQGGPGGKQGSVRISVAEDPPSIIGERDRGGGGGGGGGSAFGRVARHGGSILKPRPLSPRLQQLQYSREQRERQVEGGSVGSDASAGRVGW